MDWKTELYNENEKPLDRLVQGYSNTSVFRTLAFIGDSLSSGEFESRGHEGAPGFHDYFEYSWGQYIARNCGLKAYNFSKGGMTAKDYIQKFADANRFWRPEVAAQGYVMALGVNDVFNYKQEMGTVADICKEDWRKNADTFAGWYGAIISRYKEIQPDAHFFLLNMPRGGGPMDETKGKFAQLIRDIAAYFDNCWCIDLFEYAPVYDAAFKEKFYLYGHMNASGYILTAQMVDSYIDYIVRHNPEAFRRVGFIGTELK